MKIHVCPKNNVYKKIRFKILKLHLHFFCTQECAFLCELSFVIKSYLGDNGFKDMKGS